MKDSTKKLLFAIVYVIFAVNIQRIFGPLITALIANGFARSMIAEAIFAAFAIAGAILFHKMNEVKITTNGFGEGVKAGLPIILLYAFILFFELFVNMGKYTASIFEVVMYIIDMLLVGVTEEVLFRVVVQNLALEVTGEVTVSAVRKGIFLSGAVFGLVHLFNIFKGVSLMSAIDQAVMAIAMGAVTGAIYFRSKNNLLIVILIHAFVDFTSLLGSGALNGASTTDSINQVGGVGAQRIIAFALYMGLALYLMRKSVLERAIEERKK